VRTIDHITRPKELVTPLDDSIRKILRKYLEEKVIPYRRRYDEDWLEHRYIKPVLEDMLGKLGFQRFFFPEDLGGWGLGRSDYIGSLTFALCEEIARADSGVAVALAVGFWPFLVIATEPHINRKLCEEFAPMFCETTDAVFGAMLMGEPQGGSDVENLDVLKGSTIQTRAVLDGDEWVINGHKLWPSNLGGIADLLGVVCTTDPGSGDENNIAFLFVPADAPGVTMGTPYEKAGMAADKNGDIWFENVRVPRDYRAFGPGEDAKYYREVLCFGNMGTIGFASGVMLNVYEKLQEFVNLKTFRGKPLKENDAVAGVLADFVTAAEIVRILGYLGGRMVDRPDLYGDRWDANMVARSRSYRYFASDMVIENVGKALNLMESYGADRDWDVEKHWRDVKMVQLVMGGKQLCQMETARWFFECKTL